MENRNNTSNPSPGENAPVVPGGKVTTPLPPPRPPEKKSGATRTYQLICVLLLLALIGLGAFIAMEMKNYAEEKEFIVQEKERVISDLEQLKVDYGELRIGNDSLNAQLDSERKKINTLMDRVKKTEATNLKQLKSLRQYETEIRNMKSLLKSYVHQIDSLSLVNKRLRDENAKVKTEVSQSKRQVEQLAQETSALKTLVDKGGEIKVRDVTVVALTSKDKITARARQTEQIKICLTLIENNIAKKGSRMIYVRIKSPDGSLLSENVTNLFSPAGGGAKLIYSATREVDYAGEDLDVCVFYRDKDFLSGAFDVEVFLDGVFVGATQLILK